LSRLSGNGQLYNDTRFAGLLVITPFFNHTVTSPLTNRFDSVGDNSWTRMMRRWTMKYQQNVNLTYGLSAPYSWFGPYQYVCVCFMCVSCAF
jgi:hypothetical protein